jgi:hypothetical protein
MIHMFYVPGMFVSTLEYVLRCYTEEYQPIDAEVLDDGSMHGYNRLYHPRNKKTLEDFFQSNAPQDAIISPIYPFREYHLPELLQQYKSYKIESDNCILIHAQDTRAAELNMLFQYHKIAMGSLNIGMDIFFEANEHNIVAWNKDYTHWSDMQSWQLREWLSLYYVQYVKEWIDSQHQVEDNFLLLTNTEILYNTEATVRKIMNFCKLTEKAGLAEFVTHWRSKQQYIVAEFYLLDSIVSTTIGNQPMSWSTINIIAEAIIQQRLRALGYEIHCDGLDVFPTDSQSLYNLLEKC